jgi:hypothetical protein
MQQRNFGRLGQVSALTLGGGGTGQVWGPTTRAEAVATVREAADAGITFLDLAPSYGEARLGLGVTLALRAAAEGDDARARGLRLRAISQFAAVPKADPCYQAALYDRVLLLPGVGQADEARRWAREYLTRDSASAWAVVLRRELDAAPQ